MLGSISETAQMMRKGEISPKDVFEELLSAIEHLDARIRSYTTLNDSALHYVEGLTDQAEKKKFRGPLHGIPVSVKDLIDTAGVVTTYGNRRFMNNIPERNASVIDEILTSGAYVIGKTNTHEFALGAETPPTRNPFDLDRVPGGSSGGSAAAISAGLALFALGTDTGGSIRIPASWCGVTGFKPTFGLIPTDGIFPESWSLDHVGPIVRYAKDIPLVMESMGAHIKKDTVKRPLQAALVSEYIENSIPGVAGAVRAALEKLESEGVIEVADFRSEVLDESLRLHEIVDTSEIATVHGRMYSEDSKIYMRSSIEQIEKGLKTSAPDYINALKSRDVNYSRICRELGDFDVIVSPTLPRIAPTVESFSNADLAEHDDYIKFQAEFNYLGMPAITVPCGFADSMPVGLQVVSRRNDDSLPVSVAIEYQKLTTWHLERPFL